MGIKPMLPATLRAGLLVEDMDTETYVQKLLIYLRETHARVRAKAAELEIAGEGRDRGKPGARGLLMGDLVALKRGKPPKGETRFGHTTDGHIYKIVAVLGENTYSIEEVATGVPPVGHGVENKFAADRLVRLDDSIMALGLPRPGPFVSHILGMGRAHGASSWNCT